MILLPLSSQNRLFREQLLVHTKKVMVSNWSTALSTTSGKHMRLWTLITNLVRSEPGFVTVLEQSPARVRDIG